MSRLFIFFLFLYFFPGCTPAIPKKVLSPTEMESVLWDLIRADEMAGYYAEKDPSFSRLNKHTEYYQKVFQIHHISKEDFKKSLQFYQGHPDQFKIVLDSLQSLANRVQRPDYPGRRHAADTTGKADSIKRKAWSRQALK